MLPQELDEYYETRVEELLNHSFRPAEISKTLGISKDSVLNFIATIAARRREELAEKNAEQVAALKSRHVSASADLKKIAWIEMQAARQAAFALVPKDNAGNPVPGAAPSDIEEYCRLQMTAIRWAIICSRCETFEAKVDGSLLESEDGTSMKFPKDLLKTHDLHLKLISKMPKEKVAEMARTFRQAHAAVEAEEGMGALSSTPQSLAAHGGNGNGNGKTNGGNGNGHHS